MSFQNPVFIPGPTNMPEALRKAVDMPTLDHRSALFGEILVPARDGVRAVLQSRAAEVFLFPASGTGGWEAAITNTLSPGDRVLAARNGMFSQRWIDMCQRHGLDVEIVEVAWGEGIPADRFEEILAADTGHAIKAVLATHNETATGVRSDIAAVRRAMDAAGHPALLFVDGVSSIGSMEFPHGRVGRRHCRDRQPEGLHAAGRAGDPRRHRRAMAAIETARLPRTYFDLRDMAAGYAAGGYPYTPPVGLLNGLRESTRMLLDEGLDNVFARHHRIAEGVRAAARAWNLPLCAAREALWSDTVSAIRTPEGVDAGRIVTHAAQAYGVAFGGGLGRSRARCSASATWASLTETMALSGIATAEMAMADLGLDIRLGSGVAAAQAVYRKPGTAADAVA